MRGFLQGESALRDAAGRIHSSGSWSPGARAGHDYLRTVRDRVDFSLDSGHHKIRNPEEQSTITEDGLTTVRNIALITLKAAIIAAVASSVGLALNAAASKPLPWVYVPPKYLDLAGIKVPLIDEKEAMKQFELEGTIFVDTREDDAYAKGHVKGALLFPADNMEENFPSVQPLLSEESSLILYCYGPECEMAEKVGLFLAQLGYKRMMIMTAGFPEWKKAGYPVGTSAGRGEK